MTILLLVGEAESGKSFMTKYILDNYINYVEFALGDKVKRFTFELLKLCGIQINSLDELYNINTKNKYRYYLQKIGTECCRKIFGENIWCDVIANDITKCIKNGKNIIISDVRFMNEQQYFIQKYNENMKIYTIKVNRIDGHNSLSQQEREHQSEMEIKSIKYDFIVNNDMTDNFYDNINELMNHMHQLNLNNDIYNINENEYNIYNVDNSLLINDDINKTVDSNEINDDINETVDTKNNDNINKTINTNEINNDINKTINSNEINNDINKSINTNEINNDINKTINTNEINDDINKSINSNEINNDINKTINSNEINDDINKSINTNEINNDINKSINTNEINNDINKTVDTKNNDNDTFNSNKETINTSSKENQSNILTAPRKPQNQSSYDIGAMGEQEVLEMIKNIRPKFETTLVSATGHVADIHSIDHSHHIKYIFEIKHKQHITKDDVNKFKDDVASMQQSETVNTIIGVFISLNSDTIPLIGNISINKSTIYLTKKYFTIESLSILFKMIETYFIHIDAKNKTEKTYDKVSYIIPENVLALLVRLQVEYTSLNNEKNILVAMKEHTEQNANHIQNLLGNILLKQEFISFINNEFKDILPDVEDSITMSEETRLREYLRKKPKSKIKKNDLLNMFPTMKTKLSSMHLSTILKEYTN